MAGIRPGVTVEQFPPPLALEFGSGVAGFIGAAVAIGSPSGSALDLLAPDGNAIVQPFTSWHDFVAAFCAAGRSRADRWVLDELTWGAVQGYFLNGGTRAWLAVCDPQTADPNAAVKAAVAQLAAIDDVDLVCAPALLASPDRALGLQRELIRCFTLGDGSGPLRADWFLLLDPPEATSELAGRIAELRAASGGYSESMAIYYPWVTLGGDVEPPPLPPGASPRSQIPPSGHVAGIIARTDRMLGVHKAPANQAIEGIVDVADVADVPPGNPLRAFRGRGIRVWGARTLAPGDATDPHVFVNVRRLLLTLERWLVRALDWVVFEANDLRLWLRVQRELTAKLNELFLQGAFAGKTPSEAFSVKCDVENNPDEQRAAGGLQIDIQIAPIVPKEFIQIRVVRSAERLTVT